MGGGGSAPAGKRCILENGCWLEHLGGGDPVGTPTKARIIQMQLSWAIPPKTAKNSALGDLCIFHQKFPAWLCQKRCWLDEPRGGGVGSPLASKTYAPNASPALRKGKVCINGSAHGKGRGIREFAMGERPNMDAKHLCDGVKVCLPFLNPSS